MNSQQARALVTETFPQPFDKGRFHHFVKELLNGFDESKAAPMAVPDAFAPHVRSCSRLGTYESPDGELADVLIVNTTEPWKLERTRTALRDFVAHKLKRGDSYKEAGLVAFVAPDARSWRFSFVRMEYESKRDPKTGKIAVEERLTPARRFSYIVGENESCHTAQSRFLDLLQDTETKPPLAKIEEAFSVETVTDEFFRQYKELFLGLKDELDKLAKQDPTIAGEFAEKKVTTEDFAKKLMGQIVFLYFLQKKGWLGVPTGGDWGDGPHNFFRQLFDGHVGQASSLSPNKINRQDARSTSNFFNDILEPLFYGTLADDRTKEKDWSDKFNCRIPFLNGGLFEPLHDYDWEKTDIIIPDELFSNNKLTKDDTGTGILDVFDRYNFTVNEAEPLEKEVAIDPEMLGKVFEKLLDVKERKSKGSFYTPREIVHYMCQESLINYLDTAVNGVAAGILLGGQSGDNSKGRKNPGADPGGKMPPSMAGGTSAATLIPRANLETFIHSGDQASHFEAARVEGTDYKRRLPRTIEDHAHLLDDKLADIAVCDPAIGSGAFPVGMMQEIVRARSALTPYLEDEIKKDKQLTQSEKDKTLAELKEKTTAYALKKHAIQNCLYGVDIDPGAVEIAKLRLWLSLVVDEDDVKQIKPLPNLDYKIVVGNSLLGVDKNELENWKALRRLEELKPKYFDEAHGDTKHAYKQEIDDLFHQLTNGNEVFDFEIYFSEVFHRKNGFDVTIGNPPYVRADVDERHAKMRKAILDSGRYETLWEKWDLYVPFIERGYKLLKPGGVTTMIVSDAFCHSKYAQKAQNWFLKNARILRLDFCTELQIFAAAVHNLIYLFQRADGASHTPERHVHRATFGNVTELPSDEQAKLTHRAFFPQDTAAQAFACKTVMLDNICYITKGMVVHADEKEAHGEFELKDLVSDTKDRVHSKPFVEGKHLERWLPAEQKWLEWGTNRAPGLFSRPTFPQIYSVPEKLISVDMSAGVAKLRVAYDDRQLFHNHSAWSFVPWHSLQGVRNNSLKKAARYRGEKPPRPDLPKREELEETSGSFSVKFLLGVLNSSAARDFLRANRRSNIHLYPDDWKQLPIPAVSSEQQKPVERLVEGILSAKQRDAGADVRAWERELDEWVSALYGLTPEEIKIVEGAAK